MSVRCVWYRYKASAPVTSLAVLVLLFILMFSLLGKVLPRLSSSP